MSVIINDFEVVVETPPEAAAAGQTAPEEPVPAVSMTPLDIRDILRRQTERRERIEGY